MNPTSQQIAIAKTCGKVIPSYTVSEEYVDDPHWNSGFWKTTARFSDGEKYSFFRRANEIHPSAWENSYASDMFPNYLNSLDAMHEAEKMLPDLASDDNSADQLGFCEWLASVVGAQWGSTNAYDMWLIAHATAAQRAEAFLRTLNLWEDNP